MDTTPELQSANYVSPITVQRLRGREARLPSRHPSTHREILFIYGQHSSIERWWGLIQELSKYGTVTAPDLPGYGGMESLEKLGQRPTFDALADWLAAYIHDSYPATRFSLLGLSIGFAIVTRMLQRHPELVSRIELLVSVVGFAHHDDFVFSKTRQRMYSGGSRLFLQRPLDKVLQATAFNPFILRNVYHRSFNAKEKFSGTDEETFAKVMTMELELWKINDLRTWMRSNIEMFKLDNTKVRIALPVLHLSARKDRYFSITEVQKHYNQIFQKVTHIQLATDSHGPSVIATAAEAAVLLPPVLQELLQSSSDLSSVVSS